MSSLLYRINSFLSRVVVDVPIGTNLGLFHLLWMLLSGRLLQSRGAVIPGLADCGLAAAAVRRAWAALAYGRWHTARLLAAWQRVVQDDGTGKPTGMGAIARLPVTSWASGVRACKDVRPSTTAPRRARRCRRSRWASRPASALSGPNASRCPACSCVPKRTNLGKEPCRDSCYNRPKRSWPRTKPS